MAATLPKRMVIASFVAVGLVSLAAVADMILGVPFAGQIVFDILFLAAAGIVGYLAYDAYKDMA